MFVHLRQHQLNKVLFYFLHLFVGLIRLRLILGDGKDRVIKSNIEESRNGKLFESTDKNETDIIRMSRTKI